MPTELDLEFLPLATELIAEFGKSVTWTQYASVVTPSTGVVTRTATAYTVTISPPMGQTSEYAPASLIRAGDQVVTMAAEDLAFTPAEGDTVSIDSKAWTVVAVQAVYSGEQVAAYTAQIRR